MYRAIGAARGALGLIAVVPASTAAAASAGDHTDQVCVVVIDTDEASCGANRAEAQAALSTRAATWTDVLSVYDGRNFSGREILFRTTAGACSPSYDRENQYPDLRHIDPVNSDPININNWISSVRTYNRCDVMLYDGIGFEGPSSTWIDESANLSNIGSGWLNRAGSLEIS